MIWSLGKLSVEASQSCLRAILSDNVEETVLRGLTLRLANLVISQQR